MAEEVLVPWVKKCAGKNATVMEFYPNLSSNGSNKIEILGSDLGKNTALFIVELTINVRDIPRTRELFSLFIKLFAKFKPLNDSCQ
jgi:hypothetical protein